MKYYTGPQTFFEFCRIAVLYMYTRLLIKVMFASDGSFSIC